MKLPLAPQRFRRHRRRSGAGFDREPGDALGSTGSAPSCQASVSMSQVGAGLSIEPGFARAMPQQYSRRGSSALCQPTRGHRTPSGGAGRLLRPASDLPRECRCRRSCTSKPTAPATARCARARPIRTADHAAVSAGRQHDDGIATALSRFRGRRVTAEVRLDAPTLHGTSRAPDRRPRAPVPARAARSDEGPATQSMRASALDPRMPALQRRDRDGDLRTCRDVFCRSQARKPTRSCRTRPAKYSTRSSLLTDHDQWRTPSRPADRRLPARLV